MLCKNKFGAEIKSSAPLFQNPEKSDYIQLFPYRHINDSDEKPKNISLSLTILTNLCHSNYSVTTFVLNLISTEERKALIAKHNDDPVLQVY